VCVCVRASYEKFSILAEKEKVNLNSDIFPEPVMIMGDSNDLMRAVDNLLSNALRYVSKKGEILIRTSKDNGTYVITIRDDGEGIEPEDLSDIWEIGWQSKKGKVGSSGFGLPIAKQIVEIHGGAIQAQSEGKGQGTTFHIRLPTLKVS